MKSRLFSLLLAWVTFDISFAFAQNNNSQEDREKLSYAIHKLSGIFVGVNAENYREARALAEKLTEIKSERTSSATARGVSLGFAELRALTRIRYIQLNANNQTLNAVENAAYEQFLSSHDKDLGIMAEVARNIPQAPANPVFNQTRKSTGVASLDREIDDFYKGAAAIDQLSRLQRQAPVLQAQQAQQNQALTIQSQIGALEAASKLVYITKIDKDKDDVLMLDNSAVVQITQGFLGFVGFRKDAVLYKEGGKWKIWIEGKKSYPCDILKAPQIHPSGQGEVISISAVKGEGNFLASLDGALFEVDDLHATTTSLWLAPFEALLIDGNQLINLDDGDDIIDVEKLK